MPPQQEVSYTMSLSEIANHFQPTPVKILVLLIGGALTLIATGFLTKFGEWVFEEIRPWLTRQRRMRNILRKWLPRSVAYG